MSLRDHFHEPLVSQRSWESFHARWANTIGEYLHEILPPRYFTEIQVRLGSQVEADVAEFEETATESDNEEGGVALQTYAPPTATYTIPATFPDDIEVQVRDKHRDSRVVAVIELVSPRNKDRVESRRAFAAKCSAYLQQGLGVVLVDVVSSSHKNLHNELMHLLEPPTPATMSDEVWLYASAYRPIQREEQSLIDIWIEELTLDEELPTLPLALRGNGLAPLDLQSTYTLACTRSRL